MDQHETRLGGFCHVPEVIWLLHRVDLAVERCFRDGGELRQALFPASKAVSHLGKSVRGRMTVETIPVFLEELFVLLVFQLIQLIEAFPL
jgi:hypothetical protein